jgi:hypothetical protein
MTFFWQQRGGGVETSAQRSRVHEWLPNGLVVEKQLSSNASFGEVYLVRDERRTECGVVYLRIRVTPPTVDALWEKPFQERISKMYGRCWPHISPLSDACRLEDGRWRLCHPAPAASLADELQVEKGLDLDVARRFAEQVLVGLSGLHRRGLFHGGLRPENIWIERHGNGKEAYTVALGDVEIGALAAWSGNEHLENLDARYHPADRNGIDRDLYAVGIMLVELLHGKRAVQTALDKRKELNDGGGLVSQLPSMCLPSPKAARLEELARSLLSRSEDRLTDPQKALTFLRKPSWRWVVATGAATATGVFALLLFVWLWSTAQTKMRDLAVRIGDQDRQIRDVDEDRNYWRRKAKDAEQHPELPPPPAPVAQKQWNDLVAQVDRGSDDYVDQILKKVEDSKAQGETPQEFEKWYKAVARRRAEFAGWERSDPQQILPGLMRSVAKSPWDEEATVKAFDARKGALTAAARDWREWVTDTQRTAQSFNQAAKSLKPNEREIVEGWMGQFNSRTAWRLRLMHQKADQSKITIRPPCKVTIDDRAAAKQNQIDMPDPYDQNFDGLEDREIGFVWQPNDPLAVHLEDNGWVTNNIAYDKFEGPFALQQMHWSGKIVGPDDSATLTFEVLDCPGPPPPQTLK